MKTKSILVLEDNADVIAHIRTMLVGLEHTAGLRFRAVEFAHVYEAEAYLEIHHDDIFDVILLDKTDAAGESYHRLDLKRLGMEKIISISSVARSNAEARTLGVTRVIQKDYAGLDAFAAQLSEEIVTMTGGR